MPLRLRYPVENPVVTQYFLERPDYYSRFNLPGHEGIDFVAPIGTPVLAAADGVVERVETDASKTGYGKYIRLRHSTPDGLFGTIYGHLSDIKVKAGDKVNAGDVIGLSGNTTNAQNANMVPHLHFSLKMPGAAAKGLTRYDDLINNRQNVVFLDDFLDPAYFFDPPTPKQSTTPRTPIPFAPSFAAGEPVPAKPPVQPPANPVMPPAEPIESAEAGPIQRPDHPLRGLHGEGAANWMLQNGVRGWAVETVYADGDLTKQRPVDFTAHEAAGIRVLVRWNYSYASSDGGQGTYPTRARQGDFVRWCVGSIKNSRGVWGHIIGNEPNRAAERPSFNEPITVDDVVKIYNGVWNALPQAVRASPPAIDPTNIETADPREYFRAIVSRIAGAEFFALHAYGYGSDQAPDAIERFSAPMSWQYRSFRMFEPFANDLFSQPALMKYRRRPLIITETNPLYLRDSRLTQPGWDGDAQDWVQRMYDYVQRWNQGPGAQYVHGVCLYRYQGGADPWRIQDKPAILDTLKRSGEIPR